MAAHEVEKLPFASKGRLSRLRVARAVSAWLVLCLPRPSAALDRPSPLSADVELLIPRDGVLRLESRHSVVLSFSGPVLPGDEAYAQLCFGWGSVEEPCLSAETLFSDDMHFLHDKVLLRISPRLAGREYNVSIPAGAFRHFGGVSPDPSGSWPLRIQVPAPGKELPRLSATALRVDCDGDDRLDGTCQSGAGNSEREASARTLSELALPLTSSFQIYFLEPVVVTNSLRAAILMSSDGMQHVSGSVGDGHFNNVLTVRPVLEPGRVYTLTVPAGGVAATSSLSTRTFAGTSFTFTTALNVVATQPVDGAPFVAESTTLRLTFDSEPVLHSGMPVLYVVGTPLKAGSRGQSDLQAIPILNRALVKRQGHEWLVVFPRRLRGDFLYEVKLPKHAVVGLFHDVRWSFSTGRGKNSRPEPLLHSSVPPQTSIDKSAAGVLCTEDVPLAASKKIAFVEAGRGKGNQDTVNTMEANDTKCGHDGDASLVCEGSTVENHRRSRLPLEKMVEGASPAWIESHNMFYVELIEHQSEAVFFHFRLDRAGLVSSNTLVEAKVNKDVLVRDNKFSTMANHLSGVAPEPVHSGASRANNMLVMLQFNVTEMQESCHRGRAAQNFTGMAPRSL